MNVSPTAADACVDGTRSQRDGVTTVVECEAECLETEIGTKRRAGRDRMIKARTTKIAEDIMRYSPVAA